MFTFHVNISKCFSDGGTGTQINDTVLLAPYYKIFISSFFCMSLPSQAWFLLTVDAREVPTPCPALEVSRCYCSVNNACQQSPALGRGTANRTQAPGQVYLATRPDCLPGVGFHHWYYTEVQEKCHREGAMCLLKTGSARLLNLEA